MSGASAKAAKAAREAVKEGARRRGWRGNDLEAWPLIADADRAVAAAHDPALGPDRSVCLRDVAADVASWLSLNAPPEVVDRFRREFGGGDE